MTRSPDDLLTPFEKGNGNQTCNYQECISFYEMLDSINDRAKLINCGTTSAGKSVHLFVISSDQNFEPHKIHDQGKCVLLINNGIHPGEPDGIDASMMLARDLLTKRKLTSLLDHVVVCIIPVYNVAGMLSRNSTSRVNQNGPEQYGFRATAQNYDLNRDFVKCDAPESQAFTNIFQTWKPEIFIDTHVSNGADYQYTMTLISTQKDKLHAILSAYQQKTFLPDLFMAMKNNEFEMTPYVNPANEIPDSGITGFLETPRFSTGYTTLFNCIGMMPETHMLKPYKQRVLSTYAFEKEVLTITNRDAEIIRRNKLAADEAISKQSSFPLDWKLDEGNSDLIPFKGFEAKYKRSEVSGSMRLWYDRSEPFEKQIKFFNNYHSSVTIVKPFAYIVPQGWGPVIDRLKRNNVLMKRLSTDTSLRAEVYFIDDYKSSPNAYEGHHVNSEVRLHSEKQMVQFFTGDYVIFPDQSCNRYIVEMLEPEAPDSYFAWNFFDPILMEKEYFSDYVFEDLAAELMNTDAALKKLFDEKKISDPELAKNPQAQLHFIYQHSKYFEKSYRRYPVVRLHEKMNLPLE
ncbi:MAG: M14 family metallopeptidase [Chitinophagales bacterium]